MLEVLPIQSKIQQEAVCGRCGVPYDADCMAYQSLIDGELTGVCQFTMNGGGGFIRNLALVKDNKLSERDRVESLFVMGRGTLNFIDLCGVHEAYFEDGDFLSDNEGIVRSIGFTKRPDGQWYMNLNDFFTEPCKHKKS